MGQCPTFEIVCPTLEVEPMIIFFGYFNAISGNQGGSGTPRNKVCSAANVGEKLSPSQALDGSIATDRRINRDRQSVKIVCMFAIVWDGVYPSCLSEFCLGLVLG